MDPHPFTCLWTHSSRPISVLPSPSGEILPWASLRHRTPLFRIFLQPSFK